VSFIAKVAQYQVEGAKIPSSKELYKSGQELMKDRLAKGLDTLNSDGERIIPLDEDFYELTSHDYDVLESELNCDLDEEHLSDIQKGMKDTYKKLGKPEGAVPKNLKNTLKSLKLRFN